MTNHFLIGTSGWSYEDWAQNFYPQDCPKTQWLEYYSSQFNTVELNATFYHNFSPKVFANWHDRTPRNFHFVVKISRYITHRKYLQDIQESIQIAENSVAPLQDKLSLFLLQLPPRMPYHPERLYQALSTFSDPSKVVVEFRNSLWLTEEVKTILQEFKAIFCNLDSPTLQVTDWVTAKTAYLRLHGHKAMYNYNYTRPQLKKIAANMKQLTKQGAKKVFVFFNNDYHANAPHNAMALKEILLQSPS